MRQWRPLSYTKFEFANLTLNPTEVSTRASVEVSADISNVGDRFGEEVMQLYINDAISSLTRPVKELKGFQKVGRKPGEKKMSQTRSR